MDPMPEGCRKRVRLYAENGIKIVEITSIKSIEYVGEHVKIITADGLIVTLYGTIVVEDNPAWRA